MAGLPVQGPPYNIDVLSKENGSVVISVTWDWDGIPRSMAHPYYTGEVISIRVQNLSAVTWQVNLPYKKTGSKTILLTPGMDKTYQGGQLNNMGLDVIGTIGDLTLVPVG